MKAVRFDDYGGIEVLEVLEVREVARPEPGPDQVLVAVRAAGINPSEAAIRSAGSEISSQRPFPAARARTSPEWSRRSART
jgi:NADPH:quinone reductase-like Zn-dependent oxidoreductase